MPKNIEKSVIPARQVEREGDDVSVLAVLGGGRGGGVAQHLPRAVLREVPQRRDVGHLVCVHQQNLVQGRLLGGELDLADLSVERVVGDQDVAVGEDQQLDGPLDVPLSVHADCGAAGLVQVPVGQVHVAHSHVGRPDVCLAHLDVVRLYQNECHIFFFYIIQTFFLCV